MPEYLAPTYYLALVPSQLLVLTYYCLAVTTLNGFHIALALHWRQRAQRRTRLVSTHQAGRQLRACEQRATAAAGTTSAACYTCHAAAPMPPCQPASQPPAAARAAASAADACLLAAAANQLANATGSRHLRRRSTITRPCNPPSKARSTQFAQHAPRARHKADVLRRRIVAALLRQEWGRAERAGVFFCQGYAHILHTLTCNFGTRDRKEGG